MFELLLTCAVLAAAVITIRGNLARTGGRRVRSAASADLPCPWCRAATLETDTHCQDCGRAFGRLDSITVP